MKAEEAINLNISDFDIRIVLKRTDWDFAFNRIKRDVNRYYRGFVTKEKFKVDYTINVVESPILLIEKKAGERFFFNFFRKKKRKVVETYYQISFLQLQIIIRSILIELLSKNEGFIIHGSAVGKSGRGFIFTGKNGAGKSTAMRLLYPDFKALADDTVIIKKIGNNYFLFQTPFTEKNYWIKKTGQKYLIEQVFFLVKDPNFEILKIKSKNIVFKKIAKQFWSIDDFYRIQFKFLLKFIRHFDGFADLYFAKNRKKLRRLLDYGLENK